MAEQGTLVSLSAGGVVLQGNLIVPQQAQGIVLFAHGSGSSRNSPRNQYVARVLNEAGLATLLMDLLTSDEEVQDAITAHLRFNIPMLAERVVGATDWLVADAATSGLPVGYFGASTGAAAALVAAAERAGTIRAVVSRGGRPDLAGTKLSGVRAPTLLIVGGRDPAVIEMNREAMDQMPGEKKLVIVPGATHLFEEKGTLEQVAALASEWFQAQLK